MISCKLQGGLGNQLFQIAAAHALALRNNDVSGFNFNNCYTPQQGHTSNKYRDSFLSKVNEINDFKFEHYYNELRFGYDEISYRENLLINGSFQSEKYFIDYKETIKNLFYVDLTDIKKTVNELSNGNVITSIHIRRGDYLNNPNFHKPCELGYYLKAMEHIGNGLFIIVSDDIKWCKQNIIGDNIIYTPFTNEIDDLKLMQSCDNNIIANSSFSWWGAYLNNNHNRTVIAPKEWFGVNGPKDTDDVIPIGWIGY